MFTFPNSARRALVIAAIALAPAGVAHATGTGIGLVGNDAISVNAQEAAGTTATRAPVKKYCAGRTPSGAMAVTGSLLSHKVCKTREEWLADGVKIDEAK